MLEKILEELKWHGASEEKLKEVKKAYCIADTIHANQFRQSGEPYIIHPLNVAKNLINMEIYDPDSISAALLHDTIEDAKCNFTKEDIASLINDDVAMLVDGVTKMRRMQFSTKEDQRRANIRKITNGVTKDVRIILIKLADRLHNMRTLQYKSREKQLENSIETMELFVPLSLAIGAYQVKSELEDLALMYIHPDEFKKITEEKAKLENKNKIYLLEIKYKLNKILESNDIPREILLRTKNICTTYQKLQNGYKLENIYDLFYLKILVNEVDECYRTLGLVHSTYPHINGRLKDYISNPRTNLYKSLHTTVAVNDRPTKIKIRTKDMDKITAFGVSALWNIKDKKTIEETQEYVLNIPFVKELIKINKDSKNDNGLFLKEANKKLLTDHVYVYSGGDNVELPVGSTAIDYVYQTNPSNVDKVSNIIINGKDVPFNYILQNRDSIEVEYTKVKNLHL